MGRRFVGVLTIQNVTVPNKDPTPPTDLYLIQ